MIRTAVCRKLAHSSSSWQMPNADRSPEARACQPSFPRIGPSARDGAGGRYSSKDSLERPAPLCLPPPPTKRWVLTSVGSDRAGFSTAGSFNYCSNVIGPRTTAAIMGPQLMRSHNSRFGARSQRVGSRFILPRTVLSVHAATQPLFWQGSNCKRWARPEALAMAIHLVLIEARFSDAPEEQHIALAPTRCMETQRLA
jgi:hypothetical protein